MNTPFVFEGMTGLPIRLEFPGQGYVLLHRPSWREYIVYESEVTKLFWRYRYLFQGVPFPEEITEAQKLGPFFQGLLKGLYNKAFEYDCKRFIKKFKRKGNKGIFELHLRHGIDNLTMPQMAQLVGYFFLLCIIEKKNLRVLLEPMEKTISMLSVGRVGNGEKVAPRF